MTAISTVRIDTTIIAIHQSKVEGGRNRLSGAVHHFGVIGISLSDGRILPGYFLHAVQIATFR